ncbi:MAG: butyrate kinase [Candidatus Mcinerneyibacterium aminivorans]|uniref:Probable butyrate kinase n=1 Tax=Candidatus Mcinerneyibacterium aminivorans TaxID=2703815 RepID=A0A5D0MDX1_9BACT|nr:MAG: butyrate kinase [Candidatus Mcinerneyibacterium aminivorans]
MKVLAINPGSTSTKLAIYENESSLLEETVRHDSKKVKSYDKVVDQFDFRKNIIEKTLKDKGFSLNDLDAVVGRGGLMKPIEGGVYKVNDKMLDDLSDKSLWGREHASNLGAFISKAIGDEYNIPSFIADPVTVDEMKDIARISGVPEIKRVSLFHALNIRKCIRETAEKLGKEKEDCNFVVMHMGGGISVVAVENGKCVDVNNALLGMGPFSPQRAGALPIGDLINMCYSGEYTKDELEYKLVKNSGLIGYTGTDNGSELEKRAGNGDKEAEEALKAMGYTIVKEAGAMAAAIKGEVDAVIYTGGLVYAEEILMPYIKEHLKYLGESIEYPGEKEMEALAEAGMMVLEGKEEPKEYI